MHSITNSKQSFSFTEALDSETIKKFSQFATQQPMFSDVTIGIKSQIGTRTLLLEEIIKTIKYLEAKQTTVHTHGELFVSGYFRLFLFGKRRAITSNSVGIIHLPVPINKHKYIKYVADVGVEELRYKVAEFISSKTYLDIQDVFRLNEQRLVAGQLMEYGIAHEVI